MQQIKVKVTIRSDSFGFFIIEDYTNYARTLIECNNVFTSTNEKMTEDNILDFFSNGNFTLEEIEKNNGSHFLFGFVENISQDERYFSLVNLLGENISFSSELL